MDDVTFDESQYAPRTPQSSPRTDANDRIRNIILIVLLVLALLEAALYFMHSRPHTVSPEEAARVFPQ